MSKRGRPKGSKNKDYMPAIEIPAVCPSCHSEKLTTVPGSQPLTRNISGVLPSGEAYSHMRWIGKRCECGQHVKVRAFIRENNNSKPITTTKNA